MHENILHGVSHVSDKANDGETGRETELLALLSLFYFACFNPIFFVFLLLYCRSSIWGLFKLNPISTCAIYQSTSSQIFCFFTFSQHVFPNIFANMCSLHTGTQIIRHHLCVSTGVFCASALSRVCDCVLWSCVRAHVVRACACSTKSLSLFPTDCRFSWQPSKTVFALVQPRSVASVRDGDILWQLCHFYFIIDRGLSLGSCLTDRNKTKQKKKTWDRGMWDFIHRKEAQLENFWNYSNCIRGVTKVSGTDYSP